MKNRLKFLLCLAAALAILAGTTVLAYSDKEFADLPLIESSVIDTVITDKEGAVHTFDGILDATRLEESRSAAHIASYELKQSDKTLLTVNLTDIVPSGHQAEIFDTAQASSGYYSAEFTVSEAENTEAFLTGLTPANLNMVQEEIIRASINGTDFSMEAMDFIDTEKTAIPNDQDDDLCWAGQAANMLHYTGWGQAAGFETEDDLFDLFVENFTDVGGNAYYGILWFFNGVYPAFGISDFSQPKQYGNSGNYLPDYDAFSVLEYIFLERTPTKLPQTINNLKQGYGIGPSILWLLDGELLGGHAVTLWGVITDHDFPIYEKEHYTAFIISDSDSDELEDGDRRSSPNTLQVYYATPYEEYGYDTWLFENYAIGGILDGVNQLMPYSSDLPTETAPEATRDKFNDVDFDVSANIVDATKAYDANKVILPKGATVSLCPTIDNVSDKLFHGTIPYSVTVTSKTTGDVKFEELFESNDVSTPAYEESQLDCHMISDLEPDVYTVTVTVNPDKTITEAYYYNNTASQDFEISDATIDLSHVTITPQIGEFVRETASVTLDYSGLDEIEILKNKEIRYLLYARFLNDGEWGEDQLVCSQNELPTDCTISPDGEMVKFKLQMLDKESMLPPVSMESAETPLRYFNFALLNNADDATDYTKLDCDAKQLANGEAFAFYVKNTSTDASRPISCTVTLYATKDGDATPIYSSDDLIVGFGEESEPIVVTSWTQPLCGEYSISAVAQCEGMEQIITLGTIFIKEHPSFIVTTSIDSENEYDGKISLRDAVKYLKEYGTEQDAITVGRTAVIQLSDPIVIDFPVTIDGAFNAGGAGTAALLYGSDSSQLFVVTSEGELKLKNAILRAGFSLTNGGAIANNGGTLQLEKCVFTNNSSDTNGGAIYSDGGQVRLKNCTFLENYSGYGSAICLTGNATVDMLNCLVKENNATNSAVYNNYGTFNALYSTFTDNPTGAVGGTFASNLIGCAVTNNGTETHNANVNLYGCYISDLGLANADEMTVIGTSESLFWMRNGVIALDSITRNLLSYRMPVSEEVNNGVFIKNENGKVAYSTDNETFVSVDIDAVFVNEDYTTDILGEEHGRLFGAYCLTDKFDSMVQNDESVVLFAPRETAARVIEAVYDSDGTFVRMQSYDITLTPGTNTIPMRLGCDATQYAKLMVWNRLDGLEPLISCINR